MRPSQPAHTADPAAPARPPARRIRDTAPGRLAAQLRAGLIGGIGLASIALALGLAQAAPPAPATPAPPAFEPGESPIGQPAAEAEAKAAHAVVRAQLDAFAADDAEAAFGYATPGIQRKFGTADSFFSTVRKAYPVVHRPATVIFLAPLQIGAELVQQVRMVDADGGVWIAVYILQRQDDRSWRIAGCELVRSAGQMI